jgi:hypothetical protein
MSVPTSARIVKAVSVAAGLWLSIVFAMQFSPALAQTSPCQLPQRIQFASGSYSGTVSGQVSTGCPVATYVLRALGGQRMIINLIGQAPITFSGTITYPNGASYAISPTTSGAGSSFDSGLPVTGDYTIRLQQNGQGQNYYAMTTTVLYQSGGDTGSYCYASVQRIQFAPGSYSGMVSGQVSTGCPVATYVLRALGGQRMIVNLIGQSPITFSGTITYPNGASYAIGATTSSAGSSFDSGLPVTGDYTIRLQQSGQGQNYYAMTTTVLYQSSSYCGASAQRIQFAPGSYSGTVSGQISTGCPVATYVLRALGGQRMIINLIGQAPITFSGTITYPNGASYAISPTTSGAGSSFDSGLPVTGDYIIRLQQSGQGQNTYTLTTTVIN